MNEPFDFVKNLWGSMGLPGATMSSPIPGMVTPTLSLDEINKQIADLRAVEAWLNLNMNMLRGTIQALEVQAATIATLQSLGESFNAAMTRPAAAAPAAGANGQTARAGADRPQQSAPSPQQGAAPNPQSAASSAGGANAANAFAAPLANPAIWWNMLQDQFKQAVSNAAAASPPAADKPAPKKPAAKRAAGEPAPGNGAANGAANGTRKKD